MKKKIPLMVLESLEKYVLLNGDQFEAQPHEKFLINIVDKDKNSDFYFIIEDSKVENGLKLLISLKPTNKETITGQRAWIECKDLDHYFNNWILVLKGYEKVTSFFDDPILNSFAEDYYSEFEIIDEESETKPFKPKQILLLDEHLEKIENNLDKFKTENNNVQIDDIKKDINELRNKLTSKSKKWIIKNLSTIWAKITKLGTPFLKEFLSEAKKTVIREGLKYAIEQGVNLLP
jgi:hypothetical protein